MSTIIQNTTDWKRTHPRLILTAGLLGVCMYVFSVQFPTSVSRPLQNENRRWSANSPSSVSVHPCVLPSVLSSVGLLDNVFFLMVTRTWGCDFVHVHTGPHGKTSLGGEPTGPGFMMRKDLEKKVDPASVKEHMCY